MFIIRHVVCCDVMSECVWSNVRDIICLQCLCFGVCVWLWTACVHLPPEEIKHIAQHPSSCQSLPFISLPLSLFHTFWINLLWFTYYEPMSPPISVFLSLFFSSLSIFLPFPQSLIPDSLSRSFITPPPPPLPTSQFISPHCLPTHSLP